MISTAPYTGASPYLVDWLDTPHRLLVAVECRVGNLPILTAGLLDTASEWCVLPPALAKRLGCDLEPDPAVPRLLTRFGPIAGRLERITVTFPATEGNDVEVDATCFVSADWPGPLVIGWKGCLERLRFALDPSIEAFYFAELYSKPVTSPRACGPLPGRRACPRLRLTAGRAR